MPLRLEIKKLLSSRSDRVKCVDIHPTEPWVLSALYNGHVFIWDYQASSMVKSFEVCQLPVRCARFIVRKQWFITASDDMHIRVFNYNTMEKIQAWEAHTDYIRYLEIHPTLPYVLSASDDMSVKLWDWDRQWDCTQVFEGHSHYVMMVKFNLKDSNTFASASLDRTVKVWGLGAPTPHFSLEGHERGVNAIDYYPGGDRPYLLSGSDDRTVKIWDYQTKTCVQTLEGHSNNVSAVLFHKRLPIIVSAGEDGTIRLWHSTTYRAETTLNYGMERVWALAASPDNNKVAIGFDEGTVVLKLGHEMPVASLDTHTGKVVWALNSEIQTASLKGLVGDGSDVKDGERLAIVPKDLGSTELYPQGLRHNCNGRFLVVCGDGEYIIYTSQALRNKSFGSALDFVWSSAGTGDYAIRETITRIKTFKNFKEQHTLRPPVSSAEGLFGGACLGVKGADCVVFFDWDEGVMIRKIDVVPKEVYWSENEDLCLLACQDNYYVLRYHAATVEVALQSGNIDSETGVDASFELVHEMSGKIRTGQWVGDCFLFTNEGRLSYYIGGETMTLCHLEHPMYMLGYLPKEDRVYLMDKQQNIYSYRVRRAMLQYQTAVVRKDFETANSILPSIPNTEYTAVARFLESQGFKEEAFQVSLDPEHKFDLALELGKLADARKILDDMPQEEYDTTDAQSKWKRLGDLALTKCDLALVERCAVNAQDLGGLLLLHSSTGNREGMLSLAEDAKKAGRTNVAFLSLFVCGKVEECLELLVSAGRIPEAAFMARTYLPSAMGRLVALWKKDLATVSAKASQALADPVEYPNMFDDLDWALKVEDMFRAGSDAVIPAAQWPTAKDDLEMDLVQMLKDKASNDSSAGAPAGEGGGEGERDTSVAANSSMVTMAGTPPRPAAGGRVAALRGAGGGVTKEDGEAFEEPPDVAAASAAASASASGTENREDLDVELELQAAAAAQRSDLGSSSEGGGGGSRNDLAEYDEEEEEEEEDAGAAAAAEAAAAQAAEALAKEQAEAAAAAAAAAAEAAEAAEAERRQEEERQAAAAAAREQEAARAAAERAQAAAEAAARQEALAEAAKKKAVEDARVRAEAAAQAARLAAEEEARLAEEEEAALLAEAEAEASAAGGGGGKADDEDLDLDDDFGDEW